jgi:tetratricopeptide (TPR) repeat protein
MAKYHRKQRKGPSDEFVSFWEHLYEKAAPYARAIAIVSVTALVIVFVVWGLSTWVEKRSEGAAELFGRAVKIYDAELLTDGVEPPKSDDESPIPRFKTAAERAQATLDALDELDKKFGSTDVARDALVFRAGVKFDAAQYDDAEALYRKVLERAPKDPSVQALAREGIGLCAEAKGKLDDALAAYQATEPSTGDFYRDRALYDEARVYVKKGDKKKAVELYKEVLDKMPKSQLHDDIQNRMAILQGGS